MAVMKKRRKRYRYVVKVCEEVVSSTAIESDRKMSWEELQDKAEKRRVKGKLSFGEVKDVDMWCEAAYDGGREVDPAWEET